MKRILPLPHCPRCRDTPFMFHCGRKNFQCYQCHHQIYAPEFEIKKWPIFIRAGRHSRNDFGLVEFNSNTVFLSVPEFVKGQLLGEISLNARRIDIEESIEIDEAIGLCKKLQATEEEISIAALVPWTGATGFYYCYHRILDSFTDLNSLRNTLAHTFTQSLR